MVIDNYISNSEKETIKLGFSFAEQLNIGDIVAIQGDLGSGKTEFIKGICRYFKVEEIVTSPTFTVINQYIGEYNKNEIPIYHIDLYRIKSHKELEEIGFRECLFSNNAIKLIEWAEKADGLLLAPGYQVKIKLSEEDENKRSFHITQNNGLFE